jgi:hypothetical protein
MSNSIEIRSLTILTDQAEDDYEDFSLEGRFMDVEGLRLRIAADGAVEFCMRDEDSLVVTEFSENEVRRIVEFLK